MSDQADDIHEILKDQERILMAAWMLPNEGELTDSQRKQAMGNFAVYLRTNNLKAVDVAQQIGKPRATKIGELLKGTFRAGSDDDIRKLNMWVEQHARTRAASLTDAFVTTKVARQIQNVAQLIREDQTMGLVVGPTGIGKSRCACALHEKYVGSVLISITKDYRHGTGLIRVLVDRLSVRRVVHGPTQIQRTKLERVIDALRNSERLILLDEAHELTDSALEVLRQIHDNTGVPIMLFATKDLHDRIRANADPDHGQLYSRFDVVCHLTQGCDIHSSSGKPLFTAQDIRQLYNEPPVKLADDGVRYLQDVANTLGEGSLRRCKMLVKKAVRLARRRQGLGDDEKVTVTADDICFVETRLRREPGDKDYIEERKRRIAAAG